MLGVGLGTWVVLIIGFGFGLLVGNKEFRVKFFKELRKFLGQISRGARGEETRRNGGDRQSQQANREQDVDKSDIKIHHYDHIKVKCSTCNGTGMIDPPPQKTINFAQMNNRGHKITCKNCQGEGWVWN